MPPRRRNPLPTPTGSTASTPSNASSMSPKTPAPSLGLATPTSLNSDRVEVELPLKRKAPSSTGSPAPKRAAPRSKLGTEKTTSMDNLTLTRDNEDRKDNKDELELISVSSEEAPLRSTRRTRSTRASLPNYVVDIDTDEDEFELSTKGKGKKPAKVKGKAKATAKIEVLSSDEEYDGTGAYALNSDDEADQIAQAIQASKSTTTSGRASSAASSSTRGKKATLAEGKGKATANGKGKGKASPKANVLGGKAHKSDTPRRSAVARAAQLRIGAEATDADDTSEYDTSMAPTPGFDTETSDLSEYEEEEEEDEYEYDYGDSDAPKRPKKKKAPKRAKGRRLDGMEGDAMPEHWSRLSKADMEQYEMELQRQNAERRWIKAKENKLSAKLGRKLDQSEKNMIRMCLHHPELEDVWGNLEDNLEPIQPVPMEAHPSLKLTLLPYQKESLYWMKKQEEGPWAGGMLADEMGMGKTIQTIALLLSEPRRKPSLVVAPVVALMQWKSEIETHAEGFTVCLWHGAGRMKADQLKKFDVVLVSYGTLEASFRRQERGFKKGNVTITEKSPMHTFEWNRVILDEAHNIKERTTNAAKAAFALKAKYRWCLSGTPLQNRVGELYSLVRFLGADPFSYYFCKSCDCKELNWNVSMKEGCRHCGHLASDHVSLWNSEILGPIAKNGVNDDGPGKNAFKKLKILLDRMMLRRTKIERADDLGLPPRTIDIRRDFFSPPEKEVYLSLFTNARRQFNTYLDHGEVLNNYSNIFSLITRMRQMACHPDLVLKSKSSKLALEVTEGNVCRICNDTAEDAIVSSCKHLFDRACIRECLELQQSEGKEPECPVCHIKISIDLEQEAVDVQENTSTARQGILSRLNIDTWRSSSKLEALVEELEKLRRRDCTLKSLVFSQFVSFLDLIAFRLQRAGFNVCRLEGSMTPQQRDATIQHFMKNTHVTVFLISLKAGGVALNLTEASTVFMMDSWWNPSAEYQAMDRIHRLGQKRPVNVIKFVVQDSIEDQIVQLQAKKLAMTDAALSRNPDAALGKLTVEDLGFLFKL